MKVPVVEAKCNVWLVRREGGGGGERGGGRPESLLCEERATKSAYVLSQQC